MNSSRIAQKLGISLERLECLRETVLRQSSWPEPKLLRFEKSASGIEAGTVIFENSDIVYGYPKIGRALMLEAAIRKRFPERVAVEEKMNGYNIRVASIDGDLVALTRGGFICPYSTEVVRDILPQEAFEDQPKLVLCGEMVGPESPYVPKSIYPVGSIEFYLFDVSLKGLKRTLGVTATHSLAKRYEIKAAPILGEFRRETAYPEIVRIVKRLGKRNREGVILKDPDNVVSPIKYTTSESNCLDLEFAFKYYNDYGPDFLVSRAVREGFQCVEWNESGDEMRARAQRLGESILFPMADTIKKKISGEQVVQQVQIRVKSIQTARDFEYHMRRMGMKAVFDPPEPDDDGYLIRITKLVMSTNDKTQAIIDGEMW
jgi:putative ATP-dependent DNA ligase